LKEKNISNKIEKGVGIIQMEEVFVPKEYDMEVINHLNFISYKK